MWNKQLAMKALQLIAVERRYTPLALHWSESRPVDCCTLHRKPSDLSQSVYCTRTKLVTLNIAAFKPTVASYQLN